MLNNRRPIMRADYVSHKYRDDALKGRVIKIHPNNNVATVYWEKTRTKTQELLNNLTLSVTDDLVKGDLVVYKSISKDLTPTSLGVVLKVHKKSIEVFWLGLGKRKQHNTWKNPCYLEKVDKNSGNMVETPQEK